MTALSDDIQLHFQGETKNARRRLGGTAYIGSSLEKTVLGVVTATDGSGAFAGFALEGGVSGDDILVAEEGIRKVVVAGSGSSAVGTKVYAVTDDNSFSVTPGTMLIGELYQQTAASSTTWWVSFKAHGLAFIDTDTDT